MPEVILVRHAPTSWSGRRYAGREDPALNHRGRTVAAMVADELAAGISGGARIVSSPARRARQTAAPIARRIPGSRVEIDGRWSEVDFGIAEGLTFDELAELAPDLANRLASGDLDIDWPGGETATSLAARVGSAWRSLLGQPGTVIVVAHGGPLRIAIGLATGQAARSVTLPEPGAVVRLFTGPGDPADDGAMLRFRS
jgi:broad specificity phosphatase PhoE